MTAGAPARVEALKTQRKLRTACVPYLKSRTGASLACGG
jgi:hypothetical protein